MKGLIYRVKNLINGKFYIGQTTQTLEKRWNNHCHSLDSPKLANAIKKYGKHSFVIEPVDAADSIEELNKKEQEWIAKENAIKNGYNIDFGGGSFARSPEVGAKISASLMGKGWSLERKRKASKQRKGRPIPNYNRSEESLNKRSLNNSRRKRIVDNLGNIFESIHDASRKTGLRPQEISKVINGEISQTHGFIFKRIV